MEAQNTLGWKGTLKVIQFKPRFNKQWDLQLRPGCSGLRPTWLWALRMIRHPQILLEIYSSFSLPTPLKNFFLVSILNLPSFSLPHPMDMSLTSKKVCPHLSYKPPLGTRSQALPRAFSFPGWTTIALSAFPHRSDVPSHWWFSWHSTGLAPAGAHPSKAVAHRAGCSAQVWRGRVTPLTCLLYFFWCLFFALLVAPRAVLSSSSSFSDHCEVAHCLSHHPTPSSSSRYPVSLFAGCSCSSKPIFLLMEWLQWVHMHFLPQSKLLGTAVCRSQLHHTIL